MAKKQFSKGNINRKSKCFVCDKTFSGNIRNVNKQMEMHNKYNHMSAEINTIYSDVDKSSSTNKYINSPYEKFEDLAHYIQSKPTLAG